MTTKIDNPLSSRLYPTWDQFIPPEDCAYLYGISVEERSIHPDSWKSRISKVSFLQVIAGSDETELSTCRIVFNENIKEFN